MTDTDIPSLIERARQTYRLHKDECILLHNGIFNDMVEALERLTASPLPEEIARLIAKLQNRAEERSYATGGNFPRETFYEWQAAAALQQMARENERLKGELSYMTDEVTPANLACIRELEAEREAISEALGKSYGQAAEFAQQANAMKNERDTAVAELNHRVTHMKNMELRVNALEAALNARTDELYPDLQNRIRELEAERDQWKTASGSGELADLCQETRTRDDAIRAKTIEECKRAAFRACFGSPSNWGGDRPKGWHLDAPCSPWDASMHDNGCIDAARAIIALRDPEAAGRVLQEEAANLWTLAEEIRGLAQPPEAGKGGE